ncbi:MAG TPA: toluene monooxygenase, partial [Candidatus Dormibacteraeota bacterium]
MKREAWYEIARDLDWTLAYADEEAVFPEWMSGGEGIPRDAWQAWDEPYKCAYPEYVATQREKEASVYAVKAALQRSNIFEKLDEGWKSTAKA